MTAPCRVELETGTLSIQVREAAFPLDELCGFAARNNRKRGFLFLSKVLGKHWPAQPSRMRRVHELSGRRNSIWAPVPGSSSPWRRPRPGSARASSRPCWIGGPAARRSSSLHPLSGRRATLPGVPGTPLSRPRSVSLRTAFEPGHQALFNTARELIVVDDEISTGTTLCNLVAAYRTRNPRLERVHFVAITDFQRSRTVPSASPSGWGLPVAVHRGTARGLLIPAGGSAERASRRRPRSAPTTRGPGQIAEDLGRFGIDGRILDPASDIDRLGDGLAPGARVLVLGTGEFMHLAFRIGLLLEARGFDVAVQSTTRSPILVGADVGRRLIFADNYGEGIRNYLYNVDPGDFTAHRSSVMKRR